MRRRRGRGPTAGPSQAQPGQGPRHQPPSRQPQSGGPGQPPLQYQISSRAAAAAQGRGPPKPPKQCLPTCQASKQACHRAIRESASGRGARRGRNGDRRMGRSRPRRRGTTGARRPGPPAPPPGQTQQGKREARSAKRRKGLDDIAAVLRAIIADDRPLAFGFCSLCVILLLPLLPLPAAHVQLPLSLSPLSSLFPSDHSSVT